VSNSNKNDTIVEVEQCEIFALCDPGESSGVSTCSLKEHHSQQTESVGSRAAALESINQRELDLSRTFVNHINSYSCKIYLNKNLPFI